MTELVTREPQHVAVISEDPTGGRLVAWAQAASAANQLAKALATTSFVPAAFKGNPADATAAILMGDELGLSPLAALRSIYVVHGAPAMYARTMVALAQAHGHEVWTELSTSEKVIVCGRRKGSEHAERAEWTLARAQKAGYTTNKKYQSNPQEMLYSKAAAEVARKVAADVLAGVPFAVEDLELDQPQKVTVLRAERQTRVQRAQAEPLPPAAEPEFDEPAPTAEVTDAQRRKLQALYHDLGIVDRAERLADIAAVVGRDVASSNDLTRDEASTLIDRLEQRAQSALFADGAS